jgi:hypothetical protein
MSSAHFVHKVVDSVASRRPERAIGKFVGHGVVRDSLGLVVSSFVIQNVLECCLAVEVPVLSLTAFSTVGHDAEFELIGDELWLRSCSVVM